MSLIFIRTIIIFVTLLCIMRLMGKRQIGEMQPYELVITLIIADLACIPMADPSIPLLYGLVAILAIYMMHQIVCLLDLKSSAMKRVLSGSPSVVLNKNGVDVTQLKKNNLDVSDLVESLRGAEFCDLLKKNGCADYKKVLILTMDGNGKIYFQQKGEKFKILHIDVGENRLW